MKKTDKPKSLVLTGISEEFRLIAKKAAKEQKLTLSEWFEGRIMDYENIRFLREQSRNVSNSNPMHIQENMRDALTLKSGLMEEFERVVAENEKWRREIYRLNKKSFISKLFGK